MSSSSHIGIGGGSRPPECQHSYTSGFRPTGNDTFHYARYPTSMKRNRFPLKISATGGYNLVSHSRPLDLDVNIERQPRPVKVTRAGAFTLVVQIGLIRLVPVVRISQSGALAPCCDIPACSQIAAHSGPRSSIFVTVNHDPISAFVHSCLTLLAVKPCVKISHNVGEGIAALISCAHYFNGLKLCQAQTPFAAFSLFQFAVLFSWLQTSA